MRNLLWFFVFLVLQWCGAYSYRILLVFSLTSPSHHILGSGLMKGLVADGHEVTMISAFREPKIDNFTEIYLDGVMEKQKKSQFENGRNNGTPLTTMFSLLYSTQSILSKAAFFWT